MEDIIDPNNPLSINQLSTLAQEHPDFEEYRDINKAVLEDKYNKEYLDKVRVKNEKIVDNFLEEISSEIDLENPPNLDSLFEVAGEIEKYSLIKKSVLEEKYNEEYLSNLSKQKSETSTSISDLYGIGNLVKSLSYNPLSNIATSLSGSYFPDIEGAKRKWDKYRRYKEEIAGKEAELSYYENALQHKKSILKSNEETQSLKNNLYTLFVFSVTGVFLPLFMMLFDYEIMMQFRTITYFAILVGWIVVIRNLALDIRSLIKNSNE